MIPQSPIVSFSARCSLVILGWTLSACGSDPESSTVGTTGATTGDSSSASSGRFTTGEDDTPTTSAGASTTHVSTSTADPGTSTTDPAATSTTGPESTSTTTTDGDTTDASTGDTGGVLDPGDPADPATYDAFLPPDSQWDDEPATISIDDIDFIDPHGALDGLMVTVESVDPALLVPPLVGEIAGWSVEPSGPLSTIVFVRIPLPVALPPGQRVLLSTIDENGEWDTEAVGRVLDDGKRVIAAIRHFSHHTMSKEEPELKAFLDGHDCVVAGQMPDADPVVIDANKVFARGQSYPPNAQEIATVHARDLAYTHDLGRCVLTHITDPLTSGDAESSNYLNSNNVRYPWKKAEKKDPPPHDEEDTYGDPKIVTPLGTLAKLVRERSCSKLKIQINEVFDSLREHSNVSPHFDGRSADISVWRNNGVKYYPGLARASAIAANEAKFDYVLFEKGGEVPDVDGKNHTNDHIHASVKTGLDDATVAARLAECQETGSAGRIVSRGTNADIGVPPGKGGDIVFSATAAAPAKPKMRKDFAVEKGKMTMSLPAQANAVRIEGEVQLTQSTMIDVGYSFWLAPAGRIHCPGCDLTITARGGVKIDGIIDLTPTIKGKDGGKLTVIQGNDLGPVLQIPSIDVRGGDGEESGGGQGGTVKILLDGDGDIVLGVNGLPPLGLEQLTKQHHTYQGGNSWTVLPGTPSTAIMTSGGVGANGNMQLEDGYDGGAGGSILLHLAPPPAAFLGRTIFFDAFLATGGTPNVQAAAPVEVFQFLNVATKVPLVTAGVGSLGGRGYQSLGNAPGEDGGAGGNGGDLTFDVPGGSMCPPLNLDVPATVQGMNGPSAIVGPLHTAENATCKLSWTTSGGSGGAKGGSQSAYPGDQGIAGTAGTITVPK